MTRSRISLAALGALLALTGCNERQYVSPDTVALSINNDVTDVERVHRCYFIPVLLGSRVEARYDVETDIKATIELTRDQVVVTFEDLARDHEPFVVDTELFEESHEEPASDPPDNHTVLLRSPCSPVDDFE